MYCWHNCSAAFSGSFFDPIKLPQVSEWLFAAGERMMPWHIGSKMSVVPRSGISNPNCNESCCTGFSMYVPEPGRRLTKCSRCRLWNALATVILEA